LFIVDSEKRKKKKKKKSDDLVAGVAFTVHFTALRRY
jgi:hypothetical protein